MTTSIDICNQSLALLGDPATVTSITPPDGSPEADHCARWYPIALRRMLEEFDWSFALHKTRPNQFANVDASLYGRKFAFGLPSDLVRISSVTDERTGEPIEYELTRAENQYTIFTDVEHPVLTYIRYVDSPSVFSGFFTDALVAMLAGYLVGPIHRSDSASATSLKMFELSAQRISQAKSFDANTTRAVNHFRIPSSLKARTIV